MSEWSFVTQCGLHIHICFSTMFLLYGQITMSVQQAHTTVSRIASTVLEALLAAATLDTT